MLSDDQYHTLKKITADIPDDELEIEFKLLYQPTVNSFKDSEFDRIKDALWDENTSFYTESKDTAYTNFVRYTEIIETTDPKIPQNHYLKKERIENLYPKLDNLYLSVSREIPLTSAGSEQTLGTYRLKKRWSIPMGAGVQVDMTEVESNSINGSINLSYEIEIELPQDVASIGANLMEINTIISGILKVVYDTHNIYPLSLKASIFSMFNSRFSGTTGMQTPNRLIRSTILTRAVDLTPQDMAHGVLIQHSKMSQSKNQAPIGAGFVSGPPGRYGVAVKADGVRRFLILYRGDIFLVGQNYEMDLLYSVRSAEEDAVYIVEGEFILKQKLFLGYDLLWSNKTNTSVYPYYMRHEHLGKIMQMFSNTPEIMECRVKDFVTFSTSAEFYAANNKLLDLSGIDYEIDGLMYTPTHASYEESVRDNSFKIYKWKPPILLTVDFVVRDGKAYSWNRNTRKVELFKPAPNVAPGPYPDDRVAEFKYNHADNTWYFYMMRDDKSVPNRTDVAMKVFDRIRDPISVDVIRGQRFKTAYRVSNIFKRDMYYRIPTGAHVVSFGAGRGGDILKWNDAGVASVDAIEPDDDNADEFERRFNQRRYPFSAIVHRTTGQNFKFDRSSTRKMVIMEFMLSLTFFTPEELLTAVKPLIKDDMLLIYTINGDKVRKHFANEGNYTITSSGAHRSIIDQITFAYSPATDRIYVELGDTIVKGQIENIVPMSDNVKLLEKEGFKLIRRVDPSNTRAMLNNQEILWNSLFEGYVFIRT